MARPLLGSDGSPIKRNGSDVWASAHTSIVKGVNLKTRELTMVGTTEARDRDGDIIRMSGWDLKNYLKNPVFLWGHDYSSVPLAAATKIVKKRDPSRMEFTLRFPSEVGLYPFADMILALYNDKIINASSVGFIPKEWDLLPVEEKEEVPDFMRSRMYTKQELLELSGVAVPSNPEALQNSLLQLERFRKMDTESQKNFVGLLCKGSPVEPENTNDLSSWLNEEKGKVEFIDETKSQHFVSADLQGPAAEEKEEKEEILEEDGIVVEIVPDKDLKFKFTEEGFEFVNSTLIITDVDLFVKAVRRDGSKFNNLVGHPVLEDEVVPPAESDETVDKVGAVLNRSNRSKLQTALTYIQEVLDSAERDSGDLDEDSTKHWDALLTRTTDYAVEAVPKNGSVGRSTSLRFSQDEGRRISEGVLQLKASFPDLFQ